MTPRKRQQNFNPTALGAGVYGAEAAQVHANATDAMQQGMNLFRVAAEKLGAVNPKIAQGNLFEYIEAAKFNADAASKASSLKAIVTAAEGDPHAAADLIIKDGDRIVREVQAKSMNEVSNLTESLSDSKYEGMQKLVPNGNESDVRDLAHQSSQHSSDNYADTAKNVTDQLKYGQVQSEGTSYQENLWAAENPELYAAITEAKYVGQEALVTGTNAALAGFVIGGAISGVKNTIAVWNQDITPEEAIANTLKDGGRSALRSGFTGVGGTAIRYGAMKLGVKALSQSNVAVVVAAGVIDIGASVYSFAKGEITTEELMERVGKTGTCTTYNLYIGAGAGAILGPLGAVLGSMAGYLIAASIYQSATAIFREARLAEAEASRIIAMCEVACQILKEQRAEFKRLFEVNFQVRCAEFEACFAAIDAGLASKNYYEATQALGDFASLFGKKLQFETFEEFDDFMLNSDASLVLG
jgi:hypothetical protein